MTFDEVYSAFGKIEPSRIINPSQLGLLDAADKQARKAGISVCQKGMSVDEAVRTFGSSNRLNKKERAQSSPFSYSFFCAETMSELAIRINGNTSVRLGK